ncbi:uncharacterized protein LOC123958014 isoform X1 [Micropterus dolomieu]|uniref:uncharacterized protein LOC123958014 isoform X1 n=2 Tax=Micropterus dolomieu TaxID=147949 RepID=UPI001E8DCC3E|nr:uncharacterized protein LOC123958014 isoform X1 [Micropterus dolomieu]
MEAVIGLLLMLLRVCHGVKTCDGRQDGAQCYGTLGGTVVLQLMDSASEIFKYQLISNRTVILTGRKNQILSNLTENKFSFTPSDGTFRINNLSWTDGGEYTLEIFDSNGKRLELRTLHLIIQEIGILPIIAGVLSALVILLAVGVAVICAHNKQENNKPEEEEDKQELTYADVRVVQPPGRQMQQREEVEVEYGQVKISQRPRQAIEPAVDECVYAKVRRGR